MLVLLHYAPIWSQTQGVASHLAMLLHTRLLPLGQMWLLLATKNKLKLNAYDMTCSSNKAQPRWLPVSNHGLCRDELYVFVAQVWCGCLSCSLSLLQKSKNCCYCSNISLRGFCRGPIVSVSAAWSVIWAVNRSCATDHHRRWTEDCLSASKHPLQTLVFKLRRTAGV